RHPPRAAISVRAHRAARSAGPTDCGAVVLNHLESKPYRCSNSHSGFWLAELTFDRRDCRNTPVAEAISSLARPKIFPRGLPARAGSSPPDRRSPAAGLSCGDRAARERAHRLGVASDGAAHLLSREGRQRLRLGWLSFWLDRRATAVETANTGASS